MSVRIFSNSWPRAHLQVPRTFFIRLSNPLPLARAVSIFPRDCKINPDSARNSHRSINRIGPRTRPNSAEGKRTPKFCALGNIVKEKPVEEEKIRNRNFNHFKPDAATPVAVNQHLRRGTGPGSPWHYVCSQVARNVNGVVIHTERHVTQNNETCRHVTHRATPLPVASSMGCGSENGIERGTSGGRRDRCCSAGPTIVALTRS